MERNDNTPLASTHVFVAFSGNIRTSAKQAMPPPLVGEAQAVRRKIGDALAEDAKCRVPGVTTGLYGLKDLLPFGRLGHGVPMIRRATYDGSFVEFQRATDDAEFRRRLHKAAPYLTSFDMKAHGICLAGGSVSALLMRSDKARARDCTSFHDFDLFLVGHKTDAEARGAIEALKFHLFGQWGGAGRVTVYRTQGCITFYSRDPCVERKPEAAEDEDGDENGHDNHDDEGVLLVQVILRRYSTVGEVIHGFDLGSSAALWDGERIFTTALGKVAFENGANVLNLAARRNSYESRLARYFWRGFDLVLPDLNGCALASLEGRLPYLYADCLKSSGCACSLTASRLIATRPGLDNWGHPASAGEAQVAAAEEKVGLAASSDYAAGEITYGNDRALTSRNARALGGEKVWTASLCAFAPLTPELDIFAIEPTIHPDLVAQIVRWNFDGHGGRVGIKALVALLGPDRAIELVLGSVTAGGKTPAAEEIMRHSAERCFALNQKARIPFAFMTVEDKTALTGPFPRCLVDPSEWYGDAKNV